MRQIMALLAAVAFCLPMAAGLSVGLTSPASGALWSPADMVSFQYLVGSNSTVTECNLYVDDVLRDTESNVVLGQANYFEELLSDGSFQWKVICRNAEGQQVTSQSRSVGVDRTNPAVTLLGDQKIVTNLTRVSFPFMPVDNHLRNCTLFANFSRAWQPADVRYSTSSVEDSFTANLVDGIYAWNVRCCDDGRRCGEDPVDNLAIVDTAAPYVVQCQPIQTVTSADTTLSATTNERASCRYGQSDQATYGQMTDFGYSDGKSHRVQLSGLTDGSYHYYVACRDMLGNVMATKQVIDFEVRLLPTAQLTLSYKSPLKEGTVEVTLVTSKKMSNTPTLNYFYDDSGAVRHVSLTGEGTLWKGYMVIEDTGTRRVGTFSFSGTDIYGNTGTFIGDGKIFIADTDAPGAPVNLEAENDNKRVRLRWHTTDDDVDRFKVYRSTSSGINHLDYYAETDESSYVDSSTLDKVTYFYRVAAVDQAGNQGELSGEVYATSVSDDGETESDVQDGPMEPEPARVLPPNLVTKVDGFVKQVEALLIDVKEANTRLQSMEDGAAKDLLLDLQLLKTVTNSKSRLQTLSTTLSELKKSYRTEDDLDSELKGVAMELETIRKTTPLKVELLEQAEYVQSVNLGHITEAANEFLRSLGMSEADQKKYVKKNEAYLNDIKIESMIRVARITYLDATKEEEKTLIAKKLTHQLDEPLEDVILIEMVPKSVANTADEIEFLTTGQEILNNDPVIKWGFVTLPREGKSVKYVVDGWIPIDDAKEARSVPFLHISQIGREDSPTGFSVLSPDSGGSSGTNKYLLGAGIFLILVLLAYYLLIRWGSLSGLRVLGQIDRLRGQPGKQPKTPAPAAANKPDPKPEAVNLGEQMILAKLNNLALQMGSVKIDVDTLNNKIYPMLDSLAGSGAALHGAGPQKPEDEFQEKLLETEMCLQNGECEKAMLLYSQINMLYRELPKPMKSEVYDVCMEIRGRIRNAGRSPSLL
ncbi:MAG: fibronectin type III domain-containing protein [archaeon]